MFGAILLIVVGVVAITALAAWVIGERGSLMRPSTWRWLREGGWGHFWRGDFFHAYVYGRWTKQYIGWGIKYRFPRLQPVEGDTRWADNYHGKVLPHDQARALISVQQEIHRADLEQIVPYSMARTLLLDSPPEVALYECGCRQARPNPCQPTQVCMVVGQPFVDFVLEHNPQTSRRVTQAEALQLLADEHRRGHAHVAYFKDVMFNRFYAICNCCSCCCGGIEAMRDHGVPMVTSSGYVAQVDHTRCPGCGLCEGFCPFGAMDASAGAMVSWEKCMGCGVCVDQCPEEAITLVRDERKGIPLDVRALA